MWIAQLLEILVIDAVNNQSGPPVVQNPVFWGPLVFLVVFIVLQSKFANNGLRVRAQRALSVGLCVCVRLFVVYVPGCKCTWCRPERRTWGRFVVDLAML